MAFAQLKLQAINPSYNVARYYEIDVLQDLIGDWVIMTYYGRIRFKGQKKQYGYSSFDEMTKKLYEILRKRLHAQSRIGCNYSLMSFQTDKVPNDFVKIIETASVERKKQSTNPGDKAAYK